MIPSDLPKTPGIYKIFFLDPNLFYIGSAVNLRRRYQKHLSTLRNGTHTNPHILNAYKRYGEQSLHFEVIELVQREDLVKREQYYLDLKPHYNICPTAFVPPRYNPSPEMREKMRVASKSRTENTGKRFVKGHVPHNKGVPMPEEAKQKSSMSHKGHPGANRGKKASPETRAKLSASHKGKPPANKGIPCTEEQKRKQSEAMKGRTPANKGVPLTPEQRVKAGAANKGRPAWNKGKSMPPETIAKMLATKATKKKQRNEQASLWDNEIPG